MADITCTPFLLYPSIFLILFFSSVNHRYHFVPLSYYSFNSNQTVVNDNFTETPSQVPISPFSSSLLVAKDVFSNNGRRSSNNNGAGGIIVLKKRKQYLERKEYGLARARAAILLASRSHRYTSNKPETFVPRGSVYINPYGFHQSHIEMERRFRVWPYKEGEPPLFHKGPMNHIYSTEGQFIDELENVRSPFLANHPDDALVYFIPVSVVSIIRFVYRPYTNYSRDRLQNIVKDYIDIVSTRYPYWNRSRGADHFFVSCHDWAPDVTTADPELYKYFIRVLCNANSSEGFQPTRDVSLPEMFIRYGELGHRELNQTINNRSILAFFAGGAHGQVRKRLFDYWKDKDKDIQVHDYLPETLNYTQLMSETKFCLCPSGYEVASPRVVESIYAGCVPVIISDYYVLPFSDVLDWSQFSVHIPIARIPEIKKILQGISMEEYVKKQKKVIQVQRHFVLNRPAKPYDLMHMVMHSVWLRRLNLRLPRL